MRLIKITDRNNTTFDRSIESFYNLKWGKNISHTVPGTGIRLCSDQVIHAYRNINLGLLLNPVQGGYLPCNIWEAKGRIVNQDWGKVGVHKLTTLRRSKQPTWYSNKSMRKRVQIQLAVLAAGSVLKCFEKIYPKDGRPRAAIQVGKQYLDTRSIDGATLAIIDTEDASIYSAGVINATQFATAAYAAAYAAFCVVHAVFYNNRTDYVARRAAYAIASAAFAAFHAKIKLDWDKLADKAVQLVVAKK